MDSQDFSFCGKRTLICPVSVVVWRVRAIGGPVGSLCPGALPRTSGRNPPLKSIGLENVKHDIAPGHPRRIRTHDKKSGFRLSGGTDKSVPPDNRPFRWSALRPTSGKGFYGLRIALEKWFLGGYLRSPQKDANTLSRFLEVKGAGVIRLEGWPSWRAGSPGENDNLEE